MIRCVAILTLLAGPAFADTLSVTPKNPAHQPIANGWPVDPTSHIMTVPNLTPYACQQLLAEMRADPLAQAASCASSAVDKTQWHGGFANPPDPGA